MIGNPRVKLVGAGVLIGLLLSTTPLRAECFSPGFNPTGNFCDGCKYEAVMVLKRNQACHRAYRNNQPVEHTDHRMIARAKHGIAGLNGNTFAYMPNKDFVGK